VETSKTDQIEERLIEFSISVIKLSLRPYPEHQPAATSLSRSCVPVQPRPRTTRKRAGPRVGRISFTSWELFTKSWMRRRCGCEFFAE